MNCTEPKQVVQSSLVQSSAVHQFAVQFASSEPNLANTTLKQLQEQVNILQKSILIPLSGCTEVLPALEPAITNLEQLVP